MAMRSYNPFPSPLGRDVDTTLEKYNDLKNPSSEPMIFKHTIPKVIRHSPRRDLLVGGGRKMKVLALDSTEPMARPRGFVNPHQMSAPTYVRNGNSASYPMYNGLEQQALDGSGMFSGIGDSLKKGIGKVLNDKDVRSSLQKLAQDPKIREIASKSADSIDRYLTPSGGRVRHPKDPNLVMVGEGLWQDMNAWGKQNENNAKALFNSPQFQGIINDKRVQDLALKGLNKLIDGEPKKGSGRGRGRPRKMVMNGDGIWEDMNAWGKRNEMAVRGVLDNPQVKAIMNDPNVQKLGKKAIKTAVSMIPVIGGPASTALGMMGWGGVPRAVIVKKIMAEKGMGMIEASSYVKKHGLYQPKPKGMR